VVYGCKASEHAPVTAALPPQPLTKSNASPDLMAMLLTTKYVDGLPGTIREGVGPSRCSGTAPELGMRIFFMH